MIEVELSFDEWLTAAIRGCERQIDGLLRGRTPSAGAGTKQISEGWYWNVNGAAGEACVAKWLGVPWDGCFGNLKASDVGELEVRTRPMHDYDLLVFDYDKDDHVLILVTGTGPVWRIQGFTLVRKAKNPAWMHSSPGGKPSDRPPAYWVPQTALNRDLDLLKRRYLARYAEAKGATAPRPS